MNSLFEQTGPNHAGLIKEAVIGAVARAGKVLIKHPLKSIFGGLTVLDSGASMKNLNKMMSDSSSGAHNIGKQVKAINM